MIDVLFPPVPADDEVERAARDRARVALREAARDARAGAARDGAARGGAARDSGAARGGAARAPRGARRGASKRRGRPQAAARRRPAAPSRRGARRAWLAVPAFAAAAAAALVALTSGVDEGRVSPPPASAAQLLTRAADAAEAAPAPGALGPGQYLYVTRAAMEPKEITHGGEPFTVFIRYLDEDWTARDGRGGAGTGRYAGVPDAGGPGRVEARGFAQLAEDDRQLHADHRLDRCARQGPAGPRVPRALDVRDVVSGGARAADGPGRAGGEVADAAAAREELHAGGE